MIELTQQTRSGWCVVAVRGRADAETAGELEGALRAALEAHPRVAADFLSLDYISSAGLRAVLQAARAAQERNAEFTVCRLQGPVKKVFDMSGIHHVVQILAELPC